LGIEQPSKLCESARENMNGFDFEETWQIVTDPDDYPALF
jgi:hypothetical protein